MTPGKRKVVKGDIVSAETEGWKEDNLVVIDVDDKFVWVDSVQGEVGLPKEWIIDARHPKGDTE